MCLKNNTIISMINAYTIAVLAPGEKASNTSKESENLYECSLNQAMIYLVFDNINITRKAMSIFFRFIPFIYLLPFFAFRKSPIRTQLIVE